MSGVRRRTLVRFVLRFLEPGGVGVPVLPGQDRVDLELDRDPWGRPHLPGTSLAGGLRAMVRDYGGDDLADTLFGHVVVDPPAGGTEPAAVASAVWVLGSRLLAADGRPADTGDERSVDVRTATAIDRGRGAARNTTLRRQEVLPAGTAFEVFLRWDDPPAAELDTFLAHLGGWRPLVGHGVSRGRGRCAVESVTTGTLDLDNPDHLLRWLTDSGPDLVRAVATGATPPPRPAHTTGPLLDLPITVIGPFRVGTGEPRTNADGRQVAELFRVNGKPTIPGSALKGVLRSRCEFILRSVGVAPPPCPTQRCGTCWPCRIFGHGGGTDESADGVGLRARLRFHDAVITDSGPPVERVHVAIDRFTGGARDELLFTVEAVETGTLRLVVEDIGLDTRQASQVKALLRLVVADLADGLVGLGGGTARGYGSVTPDSGEADRQLMDLATARAALAALMTPEEATA